MDCIQIQNLEVYCHHGVLKEENVLGQKFLVSLTLYTDLKQAGHLDDLNCSINYAEVSHFAEKQMKEKNFRLIEAAAEHLADDILHSFPRVEKIIVEIKKPWAPILLPLETVSVKIERGWTPVYLSVGSNMGDREGQIKAAAAALEQDEQVKDFRISTLIETEPYGYKEQDKFLNGAVSFKTLYSPKQLLCRIHEIEAAGKRERTIHWGPRTIDLDILLFGEERMEEEDLVIPHREMHRRQFVLEPLSELAPWVKHPVLGLTVDEMLRRIKENS